ncbi:MAG: type II toxin-antitoxin system PemK/MazF family toxin [Opitutales bacterium]
MRPALLIKRIHAGFDDCLVCMISTQTRHQIPDLEIVLTVATPSFEKTGLKKESLVRTSRLAVVHPSAFTGKLGTLPVGLFDEIRNRLADWIRSERSIQSR